MDDTDRKILEVLMQNARTPYKDIAKHALISDVAVHKRIKKLEEEGTVKAYTVLVDQKKYGKELTAIITVKCELGKTPEIAERLSKVEDVSEVYTTVGEYDLVAKIRTRDTKSLKEIVEREISRIGGINEIRASIVFECFKERVGLVV